MSSVFVDELGRSWTIALNFGAGKRVRQNVTIVGEDGKPAAFDLLDAGNIGVTMAVLRSRFLTVGEILYQIVRPQAEERGITEEQFVDGCTGDALDRAAKVIEDELLVFFPKSLREVMAAMFAKGNQIREQAIAEAIKDAEGDISGQKILSGQLPIKQQESSE